MHNKTLFPGDNTAYTYEATKYRRHLLSFPMYPFRTLCPRDAQDMLGNSSRIISEFDQTSPMFPANTQINLKFTRRPQADLINYMLPTNLNLDLGASNNVLTQAQRNAALNFTVIPPEANAVAVQYIINSVTVNIQDMYLQVQMVVVGINILSLFVLLLCS